MTKSGLLILYILKRWCQGWVILYNSEMKKIIFIAGPVRGDGTKEDQKKNIEFARGFIHLFIKNEIPFYSPHLNIDQEVVNLGSEFNDFSWKLNAEFLRRCDALAVLPGWENSEGTKMEIENATKRSLPIFYLEKKEALEEIMKWMKE